MSLINQMLQDLDARRAASGPRSGLPSEVRPLPAARRSGGPLLAIAGVVAVVFAGGVVWQLSDQRSTVENRAETPVPAAPLPQNAVPVPGLPPSPVAPIQAAEASLTGVPPVAAGTSVDDDEAKLRLTTSLRLLPEREPSSVPQAMPATKAAVRSGATSATNTVPSTTAPAPAARAAGPMVIEKSAVSASPHERADGEYRKAMNALNMGRLPEAVEGLRAALKYDAAHTASRQLLFKLFIENKRLDEAAELLQDGLQSQPMQISWAMSLGRLQVDQGDLNGAWQTLQRSLPSAGSSADYQGFAAHVLQRLGRSKEAAEHYELATRLAPAEGRWWLGLGLAFEADGRAAEARDALLRARASGTLNAELIALVDRKLR
jgi:MSHA biogenesis protein MshN